MCRLDGRGRQRPSARSMGLLSGKRVVVTGVLTDASLAFGVAKLAQDEGAEVFVGLMFRDDRA